MGIGYGWQKTMQAVTGMATSPASINERIAHAFTYSLIHLNPEEHLPEDLRPLLAEIRAALSTTAARGDEGDAMASAHSMPPGRAQEIAHKIVELYDGVCAAAGAIPTR